MAAKYSIDIIHFTLQGMTTGLLAPSQPVTVDLYSAVSPAPTVDSAFVDFSLLTGGVDTGYASVNVASWADNGRVGDGWQYLSNNLAFANSGVGVWTTALGVVLSTAGVFIGFIEFAVPQIVGPGSTLNLTINPDDINRY